VREQTRVHPSTAAPLREGAALLEPAGTRRTVRYLLAALALAAVAVAVVAALATGGSHRTRARESTSAVAPGSASRPASASTSVPSTPSRTVREGTTAAIGGARASANEVADPQEASSYPAPASAVHTAAASPSKAREAFLAAGAQTLAEIKAELAQEEATKRAASKQQKQIFTPQPGGESVGGNGTIPIPTNVPEAVRAVVAGANEIADYPYVYGGGHASFIDNAYDCSGSVSYALAAGGLISRPETSGELESWGVPGPGRYITVLANAGHTYMYVDGILYDTAGRSGVYASRWQVQPTDNSGYVVRHYPGL
jgi:cell wall-associated NlpC family hydrolase